MAWFLGLDEVLSWLLVGGYREANVVLMNVITLFRLATGSSEGRNDGTTSSESSCGNEVNSIVEQLVKVVDDTEIDCCNLEESCMCWQPMQEDQETFASLDELHVHVPHVASNKTMLVAVISQASRIFSLSVRSSSVLYLVNGSEVSVPRTSTGP
ncbi:hypothetical protein Tco_0397289 [Tanacetum coccineum]